MVYLTVVYCLIAEIYGIYKMVKYTKYFRYDISATIFLIVCAALMSPFVFPMVLISKIEFKKSKNGK
jgi:hypothetical protein